MLLAPLKYLRNVQKCAKCYHITIAGLIKCQTLNELVFSCHSNISVIVCPFLQVTTILNIFISAINFKSTGITGSATQADECRRYRDNVIYFVIFKQEIVWSLFIRTYLITFMAGKKVPSHDRLLMGLTIHLTIHQIAGLATDVNKRIKLVCIVKL